MTVAVVIALRPVSSLAQTQAELFSEIFGHPEPTAELPVMIHLYIDDRFWGEIEVDMPPDPAQLRAPGPDILDALRKIARPDIYEILEQAVDDESKIALASIIDAGLEAQFDEGALELRVTVPAELRRQVSLAIRRTGPPPEAEDALVPAEHTAFINVRGSIVDIQTASLGTARGVRPLQLSLDGAVNVRGWVFEWLGNINEETSRPLQRGDVRLIRDDTDKAWRYAFGDLSYPTAGFQSFVAAGGFTLAKNFDLQPYRLTQPAGRREIFLQRPSKVEVFVNDVLTRTLRLPAGPFDIRDFPFTTGINDVALKITDDVGREEIVDFPVYFDGSLLAASENEFAYSVGLPSSTKDDLRKYERKFPDFSMFHRLGWSDYVTFGGNFQGNDEQQMVGAEVVWASPLGNFSYNLGLSRHFAADPGTAMTVQYRFNDPRPQNKWKRTWSAAATYKSKTFATLGNLSPANSTSFDVSARYSQRLPWNLRIGIGGNLQVGRSDRRNTRALSLLLSRPVPLTSGASASLQFENRSKTDGTSEVTAFLSVTVPFTDMGQIASVTRDTGTRTTRFAWSRTPASVVGDVSATASLDHSTDSDDLNGSLSYTGSRGRFSVSQDFSRPRDGSGGAEDRRTNIRFANAIVYADGTFGLGRTVSNSFVLVKPHPTLEGQEIGVNPVRDRHSAQIDDLGPAVLPELSAYQLSRVAVEAPEVPEGYEIGQTHFNVFPTYKSGTVVQVGTGATVFILGILEDHTGGALSLQAGEIMSIDDPLVAPIVFFTNRSGRFAAEGLRPGRYEIGLYQLPDTFVEIEIPEDAVGRLELGLIRMPEFAARKHTARPEPSVPDRSKLRLPKCLAESPASPLCSP